MDIDKSNWWATVENNRDSLLNLIDKFHPSSKPASVNEKADSYQITAKRAEAMCDTIRKEIGKFGSNPTLQFISALDKGNDVVVRRLLSETWFGMPESFSVRREPGFYTLCELLEE